MNRARLAISPIVLPDGMVLVAGGGNDAQSCELYDPATGTRTFTGSLLQKRFGHHATLLTNGKVLVAGGVAGHHGFVAQGERFADGSARRFHRESVERWKGLRRRWEQSAI